MTDQAQQWTVDERTLAVSHEKRGWRVVYETKRIGRRPIVGEMRIEPATPSPPALTTVLARDLVHPAFALELARKTLAKQENVLERFGVATSELRVERRG